MDPALLGALGMATALVLLAIVLTLGAFPRLEKPIVVEGGFQTEVRDSLVDLVGLEIGTLQRRPLSRLVRVVGEVEAVDQSIGHLFVES